MSAIPSMLHWGCLCLLMTVTAGQTVSTTITAQCTGEENLEKLKQMLNTAVQQSASCSYSVVGSGSALEFMLIKDKLQTLEAKLEARKTKLGDLEAKQQATETRLEATETELQDALELKRRRGSTFVRWGRKTCTNSSQLVYSGVAGGSNYNHLGGAANRLCLTKTPEFDDTPLPVPAYYGYLYGAEYDRIADHHDHDVPCSVCRATQPSTIMIPATRECPKGWTVQYTGWLASGRYTNRAASEYVCVDGDLEDETGGQESKDGNLFQYTVTACGSLPCPPYVDKKIVLCAVCSK